jgi:AmmeMemoRadiSam system protein B
MGPIHHPREEGIFLSNSHSFQTPLGEIPVDREASRWLESYSPLIKVNDIPHLVEHSIEVLLPFVKYCFPRAAIVPILMGGKRIQYIRVLANAMRAVLQPEMENTLFVVSFNLAVHPGKTAALNMAGECRQLFIEGKSGEICTALQEGRFASCGGPLLAALLQSGLVDSARPCLASDSLLSALTDMHKAVYYSAFSFE